MEREVNRNDQKNASAHLSNERTFLTWLSASVAIMAFGFVVVKFALFVRQFAPMLGLPPIKAKDFSAILGIGLVCAGALAILVAWMRFRSTRNQLRSGRYTHSQTSLTIIAVCIFAVSLALAGYLALAVIEP